MALQTCAVHQRMLSGPHQFINCLNHSGPLSGTPPRSLNLRPTSRLLYRRPCSKGRLTGLEPLPTIYLPTAGHGPSTYTSDPNSSDHTNSHVPPLKNPIMIPGFTRAFGGLPLAIIPRSPRDFSQGVSPTIVGLSFVLSDMLPLREYSHSLSASSSAVRL